MNAEFSRTLSLLRQEKGISQRMAAKELGISQALLSHYENGIREPGLTFVVKACNYYNVSADFLLGRTLSRDGMVFDVDVMPDASQEKDNVLRGSVMAALTKKLLVNSVSVLFDLLGNAKQLRIGFSLDICFHIVDRSCKYLLCFDLHHSVLQDVGKDACDQVCNDDAQKEPALERIGDPLASLSLHKLLMA